MNEGDVGLEREGRGGRERKSEKWWLCFSSRSLRKNTWLNRVSIITQTCCENCYYTWTFNVHHLDWVRAKQNILQNLGSNLFPLRWRLRWRWFLDHCWRRLLTVWVLLCRVFHLMWMIKNLGGGRGGVRSNHASRLTELVDTERGRFLDFVSVTTYC